MTARSDRPFRDNHDRLLFTSTRQKITDNLDKSDRYSGLNTYQTNMPDRTLFICMLETNYQTDIPDRTLFTSTRLTDS